MNTSTVTKKEFGQACMILLVATTIFLSPSIFLGKVPTEGDIIQFTSYPWGANQTLSRPHNPFSSDTVTQYYVMYSLSKEILAKGEYPLWNPYVYAGAPLLANPALGVFYPVLAFVYLFPLNAGLTLLQAIDLMTAGIGMYVLLRKGFATSPFSSIFGSIGWMFSGAMVSFLGFVDVEAYLWLPLILFFSYSIITTGRVRYLLLLSLTMAISLMGGHPEIFLDFVFPTFILFSVFLMIKQRKETSKKFKFKILILLFVGVSISICISSIVLFPEVEYVTNGYRYHEMQDLYTKQALIFGNDAKLGLSEIPTMIYPFINANPISIYDYHASSTWIHRTYLSFIGILQLALIPIGLLYKDRRDLKIFFLLLALLAYWFVYSWPIHPLDACPLFAINHTNLCMGIKPEVATILSTFAISIVSALSINSVINDDSKNKLKKLVVIIALSLVLISLTVFLLIMNNNGLHKITDNNYSWVLPLAHWGPLGFENYLKIIGTEIILNLIMLVVFLFAVVKLANSKQFASKRKLLEVFILIMLSVNLMSYGYFIQFQSDPSLIYPKTGLIQFLQNNLSVERIAPLGTQLFLNSGTFFHISSVMGYENMVPITYAKLIKSSNDFFLNENGVVSLNGYTSNMFNLLGVKYFVVAPDQNLITGINTESQGISYLTTTDILWIYDNKTIKQPFTASQNSLSKIGIHVATGERQNLNLVFSLVDLNTNSVVYTKKLGPNEVHEGWVDIDIPVIPNSKDKKYEILISCPEKYQNQVGLRYGLQNLISEYVDLNGTILKGNILFRTFYNDVHTDLSLVYSNDDGKIYQNNMALPRSFMVYQYQKINDPNNVINTLNDYKFNLQKSVFLSEDITTYENKDQSIENSVHVLKDSTNEVQIQVHTVKDGILFLSDQYFPGWKAFVDGKETKIYEADLAFRAVVVPVGNHIVNFVYEPDTFQKSMLLSISSLLGVVVFTIIVEIRERKSCFQNH